MMSIRAMFCRLCLVFACRVDTIWNFCYPNVCCRYHAASASNHTRIRPSKSNKLVHFLHMYLQSSLHKLHRNTSNSFSCDFSDCRHSGLFGRAISWNAKLIQSIDQIQFTQGASQWTASVTVLNATWLDVSISIAANACQNSLGVWSAASSASPVALFGESSA